MPVRSRTAKLGLGALGAVVLFGGTAAAATGNLPDAAQDKVASVASHVGIDLPESSNGLAEEVHEIKEQYGPGERGEQVSKAAHERNEARKAARDAAKDDADDDATPGKSAEAHERAAEKKAQHGAFDETVDTDTAGEQREDPKDHAAEPAQDNLDRAPGQNR